MPGWSGQRAKARGGEQVGILLRTRVDDKLGDSLAGPAPTLTPLAVIASCSTPIESLTPDTP
jgi:hypothetical protein